MDKKPDIPYVPVESNMAELTFKAVFLGVIMAIVLGAANAYVGMKAGLTVAATFPAAVVAMAVLRIFKGSILEENIARTTASVGEALVAGAIFTIPAFVIAGAWEELRYWESTAIMLIGGVLGVLFIIILRRTLVVEADLPFPESVAASEIVKAGQGGQTGAKFLFGAMGLAGFWELLKNSEGIQFIGESASRLVTFGRSTIQILQNQIDYIGGFLFVAPSASPMLIGVGFIVGMEISAVLFAGAVMGWLLLVPLALFMNPSLADVPTIDLAMEVWSKQIRPLAVGTMIVAAFYTLYNLRTSLITGIRRAIQNVGKQGGTTSDRTEVDLDLKKVVIATVVAAVATFLLYYYFAQSMGGALILTIVMVVLGFLFAAVAGYLVGLIGSSNNPISGLTLSTLLISAVLMVAIGLTDVRGVAAVLGVAGVVCVACGVAGDMMQDLKVGHILGGTPWRMEVGELVGVVGSAAVMGGVLMLLHRTYVIGSTNLPAPQAGLMALMSRGIVGGDMAWPLVIAGMFLAIGLILIKAPSPMLIAVGMYLPFSSTSAIFVGGIISWLLYKSLAWKKTSADEKTRAGNVGTLVASGFIAGESLMAVLLALVVGVGDFSTELKGLHEGVKSLALIQSSEPGGGLVPLASFPASFLIYPIVLYLLFWLPLQKMREGGLPSSKTE